MLRPPASVPMLPVPAHPAIRDVHAAAKIMDQTAFADAARSRSGGRKELARQGGGVSSGGRAHATIAVSEDIRPRQPRRPL